jgi:hypothetical protein
VRLYLAEILMGWVYRLLPQGPEKAHFGAFLTRYPVVAAKRRAA